eukprot:1140840-Pelagomonas_calceolata.AAC.11
MDGNNIGAVGGAAVWWEETCNDRSTVGTDQGHTGSRARICEGARNCVNHDANLLMNMWGILKRIMCAMQGPRAEWKSSSEHGGAGETIVIMIMWLLMFAALSYMCTSYAPDGLGARREPYAEGAPGPF